MRRFLLISLFIRHYGGKVKFSGFSSVKKTEKPRILACFHKKPGY